MAEEELDGPQVTGPAVDQCRLVRRMECVAYLSGSRPMSLTALATLALCRRQVRRRYLMKIGSHFASAIDKAFGQRCEGPAIQGGDGNRPRDSRERDRKHLEGQVGAQSRHDLRHHDDVAAFGHQMQTEGNRERGHPASRRLDACRAKRLVDQIGWRAALER